MATSPPPVLSPPLPPAARRSFDEALPGWARPRVGEPPYDATPPRDQRELRLSVARALAAAGFRVLDESDEPRVCAGVVLVDNRLGGVYVTWSTHPVLLAAKEQEMTVHVLTETMEVALHEVLLDLGFTVTIAAQGDVPLVHGRAAPDDPPPAAFPQRSRRGDWRTQGRRVA